MYLTRHRAVEARGEAVEALGKLQRCRHHAKCSTSQLEPAANSSTESQKRETRSRTSARASR